MGVKATVDPELNLLASVIQNENYGSAILRGVKSEYFGDREYGRVWEFMLGHWQKYGVISNIETVGEHFPEVLEFIAKARPVEPPEYYADRVIENYVRFGSAQALLEVLPQLENEPENTLAKVRQIVGQYDLIQKQTVIYTMENTATERFNLYKQDDIYGVQYVWPTLEQATLGAQGGELIGIFARPGQGKALSVDTKVLTPTGWVRNGDLAVGDFVVGSNGQPTQVMGVYPQGQRQMYRVTFDDNTSVECDADHLWTTRTRLDRQNGREGTPKTTSQILSTLKLSGGRLNHSIRFVEPVEFKNSVELAIQPWLLGMWLGDGNAKGGISCNHELTICRLEDLGGTTQYQQDRCPTVWMLQPFSSHLKSYGLLGLRSHEKFIPNDYLFAPIEDRVELLRGLIDSDGFVQDCGTTVDYCTNSPTLADNVRELVLGLGGRCTYSTKVPVNSSTGIEGKLSYVLRISFPSGGVIPVSIDYKLAKYKGVTRYWHKFIASVEPTTVQEAQCIAVDASDHLYVTEDYLVTHNTWLLLTMALYAWQIDKKKVLIVATEVPPKQILTRIDAMMLRCDYNAFKRHLLTAEQEEQYVNLLNYHDRRDELIVIPGMGLTPAALSVLIEQLKPDMVFIDGIYMMDADENTREDWSKVRKLMRALKERVTLRYDLPIAYTSQFGRNVGTANGARKKSGVEGGAEDVGYGDAFAQYSDLMLSVFRDQDDIENNMLSMRIIKGRETQDGVMWKVNFDFSNMMFDETKGIEPIAAEPEDAVW